MLRQSLGGKGTRLSVWHRYAIFVFIIGIIYTIAALTLKATLLPALEQPEPIKSKAPSLHFGQQVGAAGGSERNHSIQSPAQKVPWLEMVSGTTKDEPRIFIVHDILSPTECEHLIALALKRGLKNSLITPYGSHELVESTTRTNKQAWLEYGEDTIVTGIEERIAKLTKTYPEQGENLQVPIATCSISGCCALHL